MAVEALEVSINKQAVCFEKDTFSLSSKSYFPEQRVKLFLLVSSFVLHRDNKNISFVLYYKPNSNGLCILYPRVTSIILLLL